MQALLHPRTDHEREPILAWRLWRLHRDAGGDLRLAPTTPRADWEPGVAIRATCSGAHTRLYVVFNPELAPTHRSPMPGCTCGIHAMKDGARLARSMTPAAVIGRVAMWGRVIEHSKGWRAEFAYPSRLRLVCGARHHPFEPKGEPVTVADTGRELVPLCERHAGRRERDARLEPGDVLAELLATYRVDVLPADALGERSGGSGR
jgi:hypothetical protein